LPANWVTACAAGIEPGTVLLPSPEDVRSAIDQIGAARYALAAAVWARLEPGVGGMIGKGAGVPVWESLRAGRWRQAEGLAKVQAALATDPEVAATAAVNRWLAIEMGHGPEAIHEEVLQWDVSSLPLAFQMARHLLLREDEEGMAMMRQLIADGTLTQADLAVWPLFARLREDGQLDDLVSHLEAASPV
jgi:hypothetical protein